MTDAVHAHCTRPWYLRPPVWLLGIVAAALIAFAAVEVAGRPAATAYSVFLDQLDAGNIASVMLQGTEISGRYKHPLTATAGAAPVDTFRSRIPDFGDPSLIPALRQRHVAIEVAASSSWTRLLAGIPLPMWLFLGFIVVAGIVRLVRGSTVQAGTATPVHPMQGMIGLVAGLFGKQQQAVNSPTDDGGAAKRR